MDYWSFFGGGRYCHWRGGYVPLVPRQMLCFCKRNHLLIELTFTSPEFLSMSSEIPGYQQFSHVLCVTLPVQSDICFWNNKAVFVVPAHTSASMSQEAYCCMYWNHPGLQEHSRFLWKPGFLFLLLLVFLGGGVCCYTIQWKCLNGWISEIRMIHFRLWHGLKQPLLTLRLCALVLEWNS